MNTYRLGRARKEEMPCTHRSPTEAVVAVCLFVCLFVWALDTFVCDCLRDGLPPPATKALCSAKLTALRKPEEVDEDEEDFLNILDWESPTPLQNGAATTDSGVRPIAVGETMRRLVGKVLLKLPPVKQAIRSLVPVQLGVGVADAPGMISQTVCQVVQEAVRLYPKVPWAVLKVDLRNAYNTMSRQVIMDKTRDYAQRR